MVPNDTRLALAPVMGTVAGFPLSAQVARRDGLCTRANMSPGCQLAASLWFIAFLCAT